jgi:helix-turn-helix protein
MPSVGSAGRKGDIGCMSQSNSNSASARASSAKSNVLEQLASDSPFHCSAEWHLQGMDSEFAPILYSWAGRLSSNSGNFFPSVESISRYFRVHRTTVFRALQELELLDFLVPLQREPGKPVNYQVVAHDEWARQHPKECVEKESFPWTGEGDLLGQALYAASGGQAKFLPRQMKGLRASGFSDMRIAEEFRIFLDRNPQKGREWKIVYFRFRTSLLQLAASLRKAAAKNSCNGGSHGSDTYPSHTSDSPRRTEATPTRRTGATQVFEVSPEGVTDSKSTIPATLSRERSASLQSIPERPGRGFPPSKPTPVSRHARGEGW